MAQAPGPDDPPVVLFATLTLDAPEEGSTYAASGFRASGTATWYDDEGSPEVKVEVSLDGAAPAEATFVGIDGFGRRTWQWTPAAPPSVGDGRTIKAKLTVTWGPGNSKTSKAQASFNVSDG